MTSTVNPKQSRTRTAKLPVGTPFSLFVTVEQILDKIAAGPEQRFLTGQILLVSAVAG